MQRLWCVLLLPAGLALGTACAGTCTYAALSPGTGEKADYAGALAALPGVCSDNLFAAEGVSKQLLHDWGESLFTRILQGEPLSLRGEQDKRLAALAAEIEQANQLSEVSTRDNWQVAFLAAMLEIQQGKLDLHSQKSYRRFGQILQGYLDDIEQGRLSKRLRGRGIGEFIKELNTFQTIAADESSPVSSARGNGQSALTRWGKVRGGQLSSSNRQPFATDTPIRFHYDSTRLNPQGEKEYRENLPIMQAGGVERILLIGHTDPKGTADYNCWLSRCRVLALKDKLIQDGIAAAQISVAWAGENIPLHFDHAGDFLRERNIWVVPNDADAPDPLRRRVEYEINGETLKDSYQGLFCPEPVAEFAAKPCPE